jgi:hypothetical protein
MLWSKQQLNCFLVDYSEGLAFASVIKHINKLPINISDTVNWQLSF